MPIFDRECRDVSKICRMVDADYNEQIVTRLLGKAEEDWGGLTEHDWIIPGGLSLAQLFQCFYVVDGQLRAEGRVDRSILWHPRDEEWWRKDEKVESIITKWGVLRCNFSAVMEYQQDPWARKMAGDEVMSIEENTYLWLRFIQEHWPNFIESGWPLSLWIGAVRGRNNYGSADSLCLLWLRGHGLFVGHWSKTIEYANTESWREGGLVRKFVGLDA